MGIDDDSEWDKSRKDIDKGWKLGMENLKSTLEEGRDLRVIERPLIGIYPEDFSNLNQSAKDALNVPVDYGVLVSDVVPGFGAEKAGIQKGDLIVAIDDAKVDRIRSLGAVINQYQAGDQIKVDVFRGNEKRTLTVDTKTQSVKALPDTPEELAKHLEGSFSEELEKLEKVLEGVTDAEASYSSGDSEWSAKETLVHLIHSEREQHSWINDLVSGQERFYDEWPGDPLYRIRATLTTYPTVDELLAEFRRSLKETVATVAFLDHTFTRRKASYWRLGTELLGMPKHIQEHIKQIEDNINAARYAKPE
jgi:membrane-associated protease RseP (regulator of RpoE activity)